MKTSNPAALFTVIELTYIAANREWQDYIATKYLNNGQIHADEKVTYELRRTDGWTLSISIQPYFPDHIPDRVKLAKWTFTFSAPL